MKRKIIVSIVLIVTMLLMASTAFAYNFQNPNVEWTSSSLYFSASMHGVNKCTNSTINSPSGPFASYTCYLISGSTRHSAIITMTGPNQTKDLYPDMVGNLSLRIINPYPGNTHYASGTFSNQY